MLVLKRDLRHHDPHHAAKAAAWTAGIVEASSPPPEETRTKARGVLCAIAAAVEH